CDPDLPLARPGSAPCPTAPRRGQWPQSVARPPNGCPVRCPDPEPVHTGSAAPAHRLPSGDDQPGRSGWAGGPDRGGPPPTGWPGRCPDPEPVHTGSAAPARRLPSGDDQPGRSGWAGGPDRGFPPPTGWAAG